MKKAEGLCRPLPYHLATALRLLQPRRLPSVSQPRRTSDRKPVGTWAPAQRDSGLDKPPARLKRPCGGARVGGDQQCDWVRTVRVTTHEISGEREGAGARRPGTSAPQPEAERSEERRVGKEGRS